MVSAVRNAALIWKKVYQTRSNVGESYSMVEIDRI
jgi:hypothetical protein